MLAQGCRTPLPWDMDDPEISSTLKGLHQAGIMIGRAHILALS